LKKDFIVSYISEAIVLCSSVFIFKIIANYFGDVAFSEFALTRRSVSLLLPALMMGLSVGIPRYMAIALAKGSERDSNNYLFSGAFLLFFSLLFFGSIVLFFKSTVALLIFGRDGYVHYIYPIIIVLSGSITFTFLYSYLRGKLKITTAGLCKAINLGFFPIVSCIFASSVAEQMMVQGLAMLCFSLITLGFILAKIKIKFDQIILCTRKLFKYGIQRVPGDFCIGGIHSIPAIATAHFVSVEHAGFIAFGITILNILSAAFSPVGLILLPKSSELFAKKEYATLKVYVKVLVIISIATGGIFLLIIEAFTYPILNTFVSNPSYDMVISIRIMMLAALALPLYVSLRSVLDAFYVKALNTINIYKSAAFMAIFLMPGLWMPLSFLYIASTFSLTYILLGYFTFREVFRVYKENCCFENNLRQDEPCRKLI
jgi:O-antigen/teichoic acid export membrane protein